MLSLDAAERYDLPEAARRLLVDTVRLERWARTGRIPATRGPEGLVLPRAWVEAAAGQSEADEESLRRWWLERLAPPPREAARPLRARARLPAEALLDPPEAARRLVCDDARLARLDREGSLPALQVDGATHYDGQLVDLAAAEAADGEHRPEADARRAEVLGWASYAYAASLDAPPPARTRPAARKATAAAPGAWRLPDDLREPDAPSETEADEDAATTADGAAAEPPSRTPDRLLEADGYETLDED